MKRQPEEGMTIRETRQALLDAYTEIEWLREALWEIVRGDNSRTNEYHIARRALGETDDA